MKISHLHNLSLWWGDGSDAVVVLLMEANSLGVVKDGEEVRLDGVWVWGLTQDLKQGRIRHKEESWEHHPLLFQISKEQSNIRTEAKGWLWQTSLSGHYINTINVNSNSPFVSGPLHATYFLYFKWILVQYTFSKSYQTLSTNIKRYKFLDH